MKVVNIEEAGEKVSYEICDSWDDVTVETFTEVLNFKNRYLDKELGLTESIELVEILSSIPKSSIYKLQPEDFSVIVENLDFFNTEIEYKKTDSIILDDVEYVLLSDYNKMSLGEIASIETIQKKYDNRIDEALADLLCIFLRKKVDGKVEEYDVEFHNRVDIFKKAKIVDVYNTMYFFLDGERK